MGGVLMGWLWDLLFGWVKRSNDTAELVETERAEALADNAQDRAKTSRPPPIPADAK